MLNVKQILLLADETFVVCRYPPHQPEHIPSLTQSKLRKMAVAPGIRFVSSLGLCPSSVWKRELIYRLSILLLTFLAYTSYHLSRKPISIVKNSHAFLNCEKNNGTCSSWISEIDGETEANAKTYLGLLDTSYLFSYAFFMFGSGFVAERMDLRYFLSLGMITSGIFTFLFGFAYNAGIHSLWYLLAIQIALGMFQATGWPGVVTVMANWFGKGRRGMEEVRKEKGKELGRVK